MSGAGGEARLGILISGRGSNMEALAAACRDGELPARVAVVLSDRPEAPGLARAAELGIPAQAFRPRQYADRAGFERALVDCLREKSVDWVCLAGFMRLLTPVFLTAYENRVVNVHPSLLPAFPGLDAQRQALTHGVKVTGCTVHLVDAGLDSGPIVAQRAVEVREEDDSEQLSARILEQEHAIYVAALRDLLTRSWRVEGRRLVFGSPNRISFAETVDSPGSVV